MNVPTSIVCLKELLLAKLSHIYHKNSSGSIDQIYAYQSGLAMSLVRLTILK